MKNTLFARGLAILSAAMLAGCSQKPARVAAASPEAAVVAQLQHFVAEKRAQGDAATNEAAPGLAPFFKAAAGGNWLTISNAFEKLRTHAGQYAGNRQIDERWRGPHWEAAKEVWGAFEAFNVGDGKYASAFGRAIVDAIPAGSIYFGGTDPGRFIVTALCPSQVTGDPFFVLTQNALADGSYLEYLRSIYGGKIYIPTLRDSQTCFEEYSQDAARRQKSNQLKPGENVQIDGGRIQISGQVAVMQINGRLVKTIFDKNPTREFYVEESFPLDWMYPQLEPHGLIFKLNRPPMAELAAAVVQADHDYWTQYVAPMIGDWLKPDTTVAEVADFAEKVFGRQDFGGFEGDPRFVQNAYSHKMFSKLRSSQAGLYVWRMNHAVSAADKAAMAREADFAFRQAWALGPDSPEAVDRYISFLMEQNRQADALRVAQTATKLPEMQGPAGEQGRALLEQLQKFQPAK